MDAQQVVLLARPFLLDNVTVATLKQMIFERFESELKTVPSFGGTIDGWNIVPGDTALSARQGAQWVFETTILVEAFASRTVPGAPPGNVYGLNTGLIPYATATSSGTIYPTVSSTAYPSAGTVFSTTSLPQMSSISNPLITSSTAFIP